MSTFMFRPISRLGIPFTLSITVGIASFGLLSLGSPAQAQKKSSVVIPLPPSGSPQTGPLASPALNPTVRSAPRAVPTQRGIIVLPLRTSANWKANAIFTNALLPRARHTLELALNETSRYAVFDTDRFDPILQRGVADESYSQEDFEAFLTEPTLERARPIASKIGFGRLPKLAFSEGTLIAEFILDEIQIVNGDTRIGVLGRFYDPQFVEPILTYNVLGAAQPTTLRSGIAPTPLSRSLRVGSNAVDNALASATTAFVRIAQESIKTPVALTNPLAPAPQFTVVGAETPTETTETTAETPAE